MDSRAIFQTVTDKYIYFLLSEFKKRQGKCASTSQRRGSVSLAPSSYRDRETGRSADAPGDEVKINLA